MYNGMTGQTVPAPPYSLTQAYMDTPKKNSLGSSIISMWLKSDESGSINPSPWTIISWNLIDVLKSVKYSATWIKSEQLESNLIQIESSLTQLQVFSCLNQVKPAWSKSDPTLLL